MAQRARSAGEPTVADVGPPSIAQADSGEPASPAATSHDHLASANTYFADPAAGTALSRPGLNPSQVVPAAPHTYFEAAERGGNPIVIDNTDGHWIEGFASLEHAQSYAFAINAYLREPAEWLAAWKARRPDPALVQPFFDTAQPPDTSAEALLRIIDRPTDWSLPIPIDSLPGWPT